MPDIAFTAKSPLDGFRNDYDGVSIAEITNRAIVSIATPLGGEEALSKAVASAYGAKIPNVGQSTVAGVGNSRFLGMSQDQMFMLLDYSGPRALEALEEKLGKTAYLTDQSDSWVMLEVSGPQARAALERICPIDLHLGAFPVGAVARTAMEHLGAIILRDGEDEFLLMSARSSAKSFLHAVILSVQNVI